MANVLMETNLTENNNKFIAEMGDRVVPDFVVTKQDIEHLARVWTEKALRQRYWLDYCNCRRERYDYRYARFRADWALSFLDKNVADRIYNDAKKLVEIGNAELDRSMEELMAKEHEPETREQPRAQNRTQSSGTAAERYCERGTIFPVGAEFRS
jgi:hypothetical protein